MYSAAASVIAKAILPDIAVLRCFSGGQRHFEVDGDGEDVVHGNVSFRGAYVDKLELGFRGCEGKSYCHAALAVRGGL